MRGRDLQEKESSSILGCDMRAVPITLCNTTDRGSHWSEVRQNYTSAEAWLSPRRKTQSRTFWGVGVFPSSERTPVVHVNCFDMSF